ncbi:MAG: T9SS type A sorting domain-containing protein [Chitinophagales bacterium]|nr:T9SS type A sorting domain-containing protein [Chitinophagales bacterium]
MKKLLLLAVLAIASMLELNAQSTAQIGTGTLFPASTLYAPIYRFSAGSTSDYTRANIVYTAAELSGAGITSGATITQIAFYKADTFSTLGSATYSIWMNNSSVTPPLATTTTWASIAGSFTQVYNNPTQTISDSGWKTFVLNTPFLYTGGSLEIAFDFNISGVAGNPATGPFQWHYSAGFADYIVGAAATTAPATLNGTVATYKHRPNIQITYNAAAGLNLGLNSLSTGAICPGNSNVNVNLQNAGASDITSATVNWTVNGVPQTSFTFSDTLVQGESAAVVLGSYSFMAGSIYNIQAYVSDVNGGGIDLSQTNDTVNLINLQTGLVGNYTVNSAAAASGSNFQTFGALASALNANGVCGAVVVDVVTGSGPYTEQIAFGQFTGSSSTNTVTINGNGETLQFAPPSTAKYVLYLNGTDYMTIDSLYIRGTDATYGIGVLLSNDAQYDTIRNCSIDLSAVTSTTSTNSAGIAASGSITSPTTAGTTAGNSGFINNHIFGGTSGGPYHGISLYGNTGSVGCVSNLVLGNRITNFQNTGIRCSLTSATVIHGNEVSRPAITIGTTVEGIYLIGTANPKVTISNNRVFNTHGGSPLNTGTVYALDVSSDGGGVNQAINVFNNLVYDINGQGLAYAIYSSGVYYANYYHNSISLDNTAATGSSTGSRGIYTLGTTDSINIYNNVVSVTRGGSGAMYGLYYTTLPANLKSNNNAVYVNTASAASYFGYNGTPQLTYADWLATSGGIDSFTINVNPLFSNINTGDLTPSAPSLNNIGIDLLSVVPADILGNARTSTPDPGAFEFAPQLDNAGITAISSETCAGAQDVLITVQNFGAATLNTVTLTGTVNGSPLPNNGVFTINLPSGEDTVLNLGAVTFVNGISYNILAFTSLPNGFADSDNGNDTATLALNLGLSGSYTIDAAVATAGSNFQSFTDAAFALNNYGLCGPVVISVVPGSGPYVDQQIILGSLNGSSSVNTVTIKGNYETFSFLSTNTNSRSGIRLDGTDYVTIDSLIIVAQGDTAIEYGWGISLTNQANFNNILNCFISADSTTTSTNFAGIVMSNSATSATSAGNAGNFNTFSGNTIRGGYYGITAMGTSTAVHSVGNNIVNNDIEGFYYYGTYFYYQDSTEISGNNFVQRANGSTTCYGMNLNYNYYGIVTGNRVITSAATTNYGLYGTNCYGLPTQYADWSNNMISCIGGTGTTYGIYSFNSYYLNLYHNSVIVTGGSATGGRALYLNSSSSGNYGFVNVKNNVGVNTGLGYAVEISAAAHTLGYVSSMDRNNWYAAGAVLGRYNGINSATIGAWTTASLKDTNSVSVSPGFFSNEDLHVTSNFLNDRGEVGLGINVDFDGDVRCPNGGCSGATVRPDIGADEFLGTPITVDMGVLSLDSPLIKSCYTATEPISVSIKNFNTQPIDFGAEPVSVTVYVSGALTDTLGPVVISAGALAADSLLSVTVDSAFDMTATGTYVFFVDVFQLNDANGLNDTLTASIDFNTGVTEIGYAEICSGSSIELSLSDFSGAVQWQSYDAQNNNWINETGPGSDSVKYSVSPTANTLYRTLTCGNYPSTIDTIVPILVSNPIAQNDTICGSGIATVTALGTGDENVWYAAATGGNSLFTGDTFSVAVNTDTTFYVESNKTLAGGSGALKITEIDVDGTTDKIEIQNLSSQPLNTAGWVVAISNSYTILNTVNATLWNLPASIAPGQILYKTDATANNYWGSNILWNPSQQGWAMIIDNNGLIRDLVVMDWPSTALPSFSAVINGFNMSIAPNDWSGNGVDITSIPTGTSINRTGNSDSNTAADFVWASLSINAQNAGLSSVFVGGSCNSQRVPVSVKVNPLPSVDLGADTTQCGGTVSLDAGNAGSSFSWNTSDVSQTILVTATANPSVTVTDANGCSASDNISVTIGSFPVVNIGNDVLQCGGSVLLDAGNAGANFAWNNGATTQDITATFTDTYSVTVTNAANCSASDTAIVTINDLPVINLGADVVQCGGSVVLDAANAGSGFAWSSGETSQTITLTASSSNSVTVTDANNCSASDSIDVVINEVPVIDLGSDVSQCAGSVTLDAQNSGATYLWSNGATTQTLEVIATATVDVLVTNASNCSASDTVEISINDFPVVNLGNDVEQCAGTVALDAGNAGSTFTWSNGLSTQSITVNSSGTYSVNVESPEGCETQDTVEIVINPLPAVTFTLDDTLCLSTSPLTLTGGLPLGGTYSGTDVNNGIFAPSATGVVAITYLYVDSNNCSNSSTENVLVDVCSGISDVVANLSMDVYPNPSSGKLNVVIGDFLPQTYTLQLLASDGRLVWSGRVAEQQTVLNLEFMAKGVYTLQLRGPGVVGIKRIILE